MDNSLLIDGSGNVTTVCFNKPKKKNAIDQEMFKEFPTVLKRASDDPKILMVVITGCNDYFTSGLDMNFVIQESNSNTDVEEIINNTAIVIDCFVKALIDFPKPLVAIVNGPAVGLGVTMLGLCDFVFASDKATFYTPFTSLGLIQEGCSSYTFPRMMGHGRAYEMLVLGKKITAQEAVDRNLVHRIYGHSNLDPVWKEIKGWAQFPTFSFLSSKSIMRNHVKDALYQACDMEIDALKKCWSSEEFLQAVMSFFTRKSKL